MRRDDSIYVLHAIEAAEKAILFWDTIKNDLPDVILLLKDIV